MNYQHRNNSRGRAARYATAIKVAVGAVVIVGILSIFAHGPYPVFSRRFFLRSGASSKARTQARSQCFRKNCSRLMRRPSRSSPSSGKMPSLSQCSAASPSKTPSSRPSLRSRRFPNTTTSSSTSAADHGVAVGDTVYAVSPLTALQNSAATELATSTIATSTVATSTAANGVKVPIGVVNEVDPTTSKVDLSRRRMKNTM